MQCIVTYGNVLYWKLSTIRYEIYFFITVNILHSVWVLNEVNILQFILSTGCYFDHLLKAK